MRLAFTQERFSYAGKYYTFHDVCMIPKPYQKPHPPLRAAATTRETFGVMGHLGLPIFASLGTAVVSDIAPALQEYRDAWRQAGHPGDGDVMLRLPVYVAHTMERALSEPEASTMHHYSRLRQAFLRSANAAGSDARATRAERLTTLTYEDVLRDRVVFGTPEQVVERLQTLVGTLDLSGLIMEGNTGGRIPPECVLQSIRLFGQEVAPALRASVA
jgi:alkanesulfonate monooxygenase SsuD/methylene tetrahydromethanopterin reductase-like flavin-dependent oxidoreductase (luciferase family)